MIIDFKEHRIITQNETIWLTNIQNQLLEILYSDQGKVVTYKDMIDKIYQTECDEMLKSLVRRHITLLRKKVGQHIKIKNVREIGYIIEEDLK